MRHSCVTSVLAWCYGMGFLFSGQLDICVFQKMYWAFSCFSPKSWFFHPKGGVALVMTLNYMQVEVIVS